MGNTPIVNLNEQHKGKWIFGAFAEPDGTASFGRIGSALSLLAVIAWVCYLVYHNHMLPDLGGPSVFVGAPYAINKTATAFGKFNS
jgi:hypothetical protein